MGPGKRSAIRPAPYLPFLSGPASIAPDLKPISSDDWLLPDTEAAAWLPAKTTLMQECREDVFACLPDSVDAASEAADMVRKATASAKSSPKMFPNDLETAASQISDDLCVMTQHGDGYRLGAASLCAPTFWRLSDKIGRPLGGLHEEVPDGDPQLASRISRIFAGLRPELILERFNWTVQLGAERYTPTSKPMKQRLTTLSPDDAAALLHLRVERQTVRKLPVSNAVLFTIRIALDPLAPILRDSETRAAFRESWQQTDSRLRQYKGWSHYEASVEHLLKAV